MIELLGKSLEELQSIFKTHNIQKFRAKQLIDYIYHRYIFDFEEMTQYPKELRQWLSDNCVISLPTLITESVSPDGKTRKILVEMTDQSRVEAVLMEQHYGYSVCVSSQVGCAMGCVFCASTQGGLYRDLTVSEIIGQVVTFGALTKEQIHSVVVPNIYKLADEGLPITLALSLHATNNEVRRSIMPVGARYELTEVLDAVKYYYDTTQRRITFEYILIDSVNASMKEAHALGKICKDFPNCHVNLIPVNGNEHIELYKPSITNMNTFKDIVASYGVSVTVRKEMGDAIQAACGQLKAAHGREKENYE